ncbi:hypothetical protein HK097_003555, partial [Rhizophlyctis rosea]
MPGGGKDPSRHVVAQPQQSAQPSAPAASQPPAAEPTTNPAPSPAPTARPPAQSPPTATRTTAPAPQPPVAQPTTGAAAQPTAATPSTPTNNAPADPNDPFQPRTDWPNASNVPTNATPSNTSSNTSNASSGNQSFWEKNKRIFIIVLSIVGFILAAAFGTLIYNKCIKGEKDDDAVISLKPEPVAAISSRPASSASRVNTLNSNNGGGPRPIQQYGIDTGPRMNISTPGPGSGPYWGNGGSVVSGGRPGGPGSAFGGGYAPTG